MTGASRPSVRVGKRALAAFAAGSIAVPLSFGLMGGTAFAAAQGSSTPPAPTSIQGVCPTGQTPDSNFPDTQTDFFKDAINCLVAYGVTQGYPDGNYKPSLNVNREQMALFFFRVGKAAGMSWNTSDAGFKDINTASSQEAKDAINALANAKVINGFTDGTYRPAVVVQRDAMAKFIANTVKVLGGPDLTTSTNDYYTDDAGNIFESFINGITDGKISNGMGGHTYGVGQPVARDAMAGFISRSMEVLFDAGKLPGQFGAVKLNSTSVAQGGTLTGTVQGTNVSVSGCGLTNQALPDTDSSAAGSQFSVTIPSSQATGDCTLTFSYTDANGTSQTAQRTITVTQAQNQSNQTYAVTPNTTQNVNTANADQNVTYSVTGLPASSTVTVTLFTCANVSNNNGAVTFKNSSNPGGTGNVANAGTVAPTTIGITAVNSNGMASAQSATLTTSASGTGTFTVTAFKTKTGCAVPIVWKDSNGNGSLDLGTNNQPTEPFGAGGAVNAIQSATQGQFNGGTTPASMADTVDVAPTSTQFTQNGLTYTYGANDQYQLVKPVTGGSASCQPSTYAEFQSRLTQGDMVGGFYNPTGQSVFCLDDIAPSAPTNVTTSANSTNGGVAVTFDDLNNGATAYTVFRAKATPPATGTVVYTCPAAQPAWGTASPQAAPSTVNSAWTAITTVNDTKTSGTYTYNDTSIAPPAGTTTSTDRYCYAVSSVAPNGAGSTQTGTGATNTGNTATAPANQPASGTAGAPAISAIGADGTSINVIYGSAVNGSTVDTADYKVFTTHAGVSTQQTVSAAAQKSPTMVELTVPAMTDGDSVTVTAQQGSDGNTVCAAGSTTVCEAVGDSGNTVIGTPIITGASSSAAAGTIVLTYSSALDCASVDNDYTVTKVSGTGTATGWTATCSGSTVTLTSGSGTEVAGDVFTVTAKKGTDGNTVLDVSDTYQEPVGDSWQVTAGA